MAQTSSTSGDDGTSGDGGSGGIGDQLVSFAKSTEGMAVLGTLALVAVLMWVI